MTPAACRSAAVSWIEAITSLRYCLVIASNLLQCADLQCGGNVRVAVSQQLRGEHSERHKLAVPNVALVTLGKAVNEERTIPGPPQNDRTEPAGVALTGAGNALLDHSAAQVRIDEPALRVRNCRPQLPI